jgi:hypothetical protein
MAIKKMWLSKYALTSGIREVSVEPRTYPNPLYASVRDGGGSGIYNYRVGRDIHETKREALDAAEKKKRTSKIKALQRQLKKLKDLKFE